MIEKYTHTMKTAGNAYIKHLLSIYLPVPGTRQIETKILVTSFPIIRSPACTSRAGGASSFAQRERTREGSSPMLVISRHRSRKGTPP